MKKQFLISNEEKNRILGLHESMKPNHGTSILNEQVGRVLKWVTKLFKGKGGVEAAELAMKQASKGGWKKSQNDILELALATQGKSNKSIGTWISKSSGTALNGDAIMTTFQLASANPQNFLKNIDRYMKVIPREVVNGQGTLVKLRDPFKEYLESLITQSTKSSKPKAKPGPPNTEKFTPRGNQPGSGGSWTGSN